MTPRLTITTGTGSDAEDSEYYVVQYSCHYCRQYNGFTTISLPRCERIDITVVGDQATDFTFYEWIINKSTLSGTLYYDDYGPNDEKREIKFTNARCYAIAEHYDINGDSQRTFTLSIVPKEVTIYETAFDHL